jgi:hypothetical protein
MAEARRRELDERRRVNPCHACAGVRRVPVVEDGAERWLECYDCEGTGVAQVVSVRSRNVLQLLDKGGDE